MTIEDLHELLSEKINKYETESNGIVHCSLFFCARLSFTAAIAGSWLTLFFNWYG